jgi:aryl-alcohol dehydrogenase-like predicted oxidoreductase
VTTAETALSAQDGRPLGPFTVKAVGLGCMNMSWAYGPALPQDEAARLLNDALDMGYDHLDTAALYGFGANETLIGEAIGHRRREYTLASKCGLIKGPDGKREINGAPQSIRATCEAALKRLKTDVIDLYYLHRRDRNVPIADSVGAMADLKAEGKIRALGLSEISAELLRQAHAVHPIAAVQTEYSLWTRNPEIAVLDTCRELGTTFVAFSPLGRAFLTGVLRDVATLAPGDLRRSMPRFAPDAYARNLALLDALARLATDAGCSMAQLALAWTLAKAPHIVSIPGTTRLDHLAENFAALDVSLSADIIAAADALINERTVIGPRYNDAAQADVDTEEFA